MTTHFATEDPDEIEQSPCGTPIGKSSDASGNWSHVDCGRCLNRKTKITAAHAAEERAIVEQMGDMADFMKQAASAAEIGKNMP
jgi:hypothetical protein